MTETTMNPGAAWSPDSPTMGDALRAEAAEIRGMAGEVSTSKTLTPFVMALALQGIAKRLEDIAERHEPEASRRGWWARWFG